MKPITPIIIGIFLLPLLLGALMSKIAYDHNPQGAIYDTLTGKIDVVYLSEIFLSWVIVGLLVIFAGYAVFLLIRKSTSRFFVKIAVGILILLPGASAEVAVPAASPVAEPTSKSATSPAKTSAPVALPPEAPLALPPPPKALQKQNPVKRNVLESIDLTDLFKNGGGSDDDRLIKVNRHKQVIGNRRADNHLPWPPEGSPYHTEAFLWDNGKITVLNPRNSERDLYTIATDMNDSGQIVGSMEMETPGIQHAFLWSRGKLTDLGMLPGMDSCGAQNINNSGKITGTCTGLWGQVGASFYWEWGKMTSIPDDVPPHSSNDYGQSIGGAYLYIRDGNKLMLWKKGMTSLQEIVLPDHWGVINTKLDNKGVIRGFYIQKGDLKTPPTYHKFLWKGGRIAEDSEFSLKDLRDELRTLLLQYISPDLMLDKAYSISANGYVLAYVGLESERYTFKTTMKQVLFKIPSGVARDYFSSYLPLIDL